MAMNMCFRQIVNIYRLSNNILKVPIFNRKLASISHLNANYVGRHQNTNYVERHRTHTRLFATSGRLYNVNNVSEEQLKKLIDQLGEKFTEARELLEDARESEGTVYFSEDLEDAQEAVVNTLEEYNKLLETISEAQKETVVRTIGLRMGELRAQLDAINESLKD